MPQKAGEMPMPQKAGETPAPPNGWRAWPPSWSCIEHVEQVLALFPGAVDRLELAEWRGPMQAKVRIAPVSGGSRADFDLNADASAALGWGSWFAKPRGEPLSVTAGLTLPHRRRRAR